MKNKLRIIFIVIILLLGGTALYARFIGTKGLVVKEYGVINEKLPNSFNGFKIVHFTDLHYGRTVDLDDVEFLVEEINKLKPELVVFTGDLIDKDIAVTTEIEQIISDSLGKIDAKIDKLAIKGNHDYYNNVNYETILSNAGFTVLNNNSMYMYNESTTPILISGLSSFIKDFPNYEESLTKDEISIDEIKDLYKIVLVHEPDVIKNLENYDIDLVLAGHSHNGQVRLPFVGALITPYGSRTYYDSYYKVNSTDLYISSGVGTSSYNFRLLNKPSFNIYRLYNY